MDNLFFLVRRGKAPGRYVFEVTPEVAVGPPGRLGLFGGVGLGAALQAAETEFSLPVLWATAHFLTRPKLGDVIDFAVQPLVTGRRVVQARVSGSVGEQPALVAICALGGEVGEGARTWGAAPKVSPPESSIERGHWRGPQQGLHARLDVRRAEPDVERPGAVCLWVRPREPVLCDVGLMSVVGDLLPGVFWSVAPQFLGGSSLDNTLRIQALPQGDADWMLCHAEAQALRGAVGQGAMRIYDRAGNLLATASQSLLLRRVAAGERPETASGGADIQLDRSHSADA